MAENTTVEFLNFAGLSAYDAKIKAFAQAIADKIKTDIIDGAPETYDTLKEISTYIASHKDEYSDLTAIVGDKAAQSDLTAAVNRIVALEASIATNTTDIDILENKLVDIEQDAKSYTDTKVASLVNGAPETLDTLKEVADAIKVNENVVAALNSAIGDKANKSDVENLLNNKADKIDVNAALSNKLNTNGNASDTIIEFTEPATRENINSSEKQSTLWGKVKKWFSDLKPVAFSGKYTDLSDTPTVERLNDGEFLNGDAITQNFISTDENGKITNIQTFDSTLNLSDVAFSGKYDDLIGKPAQKIKTDNGKIEIFDGRNFVEMQKAYKTYGVSIDLTNSDPASAVTYTDAAVGMIAGSSDWDNANIFRDIRPCLFKDGAVKGYLNPNDFAKYIDGTDADISTGAEGDVMIEIPKLGVKIATSDNTLTVQVTDDPNAEGFSYLAHTREKSGDKDKLYIGAFLGYNLSSQLRSLCDKVPTSSNTIGQTRTLAQANGDGYDQIAFYQLTLLQCLFLIKYKSRNSQTALGRGFTLSSMSHPIKTGGTIAKGMDFGETTGRQQMKFLGIEDFWGNLYHWIDGLVSSSNFHALTATINFNDSGTGYNDLGQIVESNPLGYMKIPQGTNELGFISQVGGASETTYFTDGANFINGRVPYFGGHQGEWGDGAFRLYVGAKVSDKGSYCGGRLMYL
ncbi:hypothetical protein FMM68_07190 [Lachnospiraceae bacterium MD329]|nr:hypothetical protein [Lachnospiraceae bacterium MD329]